MENNNVENRSRENNSIEKKDIDIILLAPKDDLPKDDVYIEFLSASLSKKETCNIALSGEYGSGKSSIIRSFLKHNDSRGKEKKLKCICISLANFKNDESDTNVLEKSILKQLFYKTSTKDIPNSRFSRVEDIGMGESLKLVGLIILIILPIIIFNWTSINKTFLPKMNIFVKAIPIILSLIGIVLIINKIMNRFNLKSIKGEKILTVEVEENKPENAFDMYIDEIMYLFKRKKYDVVFFEDIDRFKDSISIFTALRELNEILNDSEELPEYKDKKKLKFVYAIKDSVFFEEEIKTEKEEVEKNKNLNYKYGLEKSKLRTKFFDYIIPVIPAVDSNNSYEEIKVLFDEYNKNLEKEEQVEISKELLIDISIYVDDMRLLINTFNEFIIYVRKHKKYVRTQSNRYDKLFAIILYKNMYPIDFMKINKNDGDLYDIFKNKNKYIKERINGIEKEIEEVKNKIELTEKECLRSKEEVLKLYKVLLIQKIGNLNPYTYLKGKGSCNINDITLEDIHDIGDSDRIVEGFGDILERLERVDKNTNIQNKEKLEILEKEREICKMSTIRELIKGKNDIFKAEIKEKDILRVFLRNGYIEEDYNDYISLLKVGRRSKNDNDFLKLVSNKTGEWRECKNYRLDNAKYIFSIINENELSDKYSLNFDMMEFVLKNIESKENENRVRRYLKQFEVIDIEKAEFISEYIKEKSDTAKMFIRQILNINKYLFNQFIEKSNNIEEHDRIFLEIINASYIGEIEDSDGTIERYILGKENFVYMKVCQDYANKIINLIEKLDIKFEKLIVIKNELKNEVSEYIYKKNKYVINRNMIKFILNLYNVFYENEEEYFIYGKIKKTKLEAMIKYIDNNIQKFVTDVYIQSDSDIEDTGVLELLNREDIDIDDRIEIIRNKTFIIENLSEIKIIGLYRTIMESKKLKNSWDNIEYYYKTSNSRDVLTEYLNNNKFANSLSEMEMGENDELEAWILVNEKISEENIKLLTKAFDKPFISGIFNEDMSIERMKCLIDIGMVRLSKENYNDLKNDDLRVKLILTDIDEYINNISEYQVDTKEISGILKGINEKRKQIKLLSYIDRTYLNMPVMYKQLKDILGEEKEDGCNDIRSEIKKCEIEYLLLNNENKSKKEILKELARILSKEEIFKEINKIPVSREEALYYFDEDLIEAGFEVSYEEDDMKIISINEKAIDEVAITEER